MQDRGFSELHLNTAPRDELRKDGLFMPTIVVDGILKMRMRRHERTLEVDNQALVDGMRQVEPEHPSSILFRSLEKDERKIANVTLETSQPEATIWIKPNYTDKDDEKGAFRKLNESFWLGTLATQAIARDQYKQILANKPEPSIPKMLIRSSALFICTSVGTAAIPHANDLSELVTNATTQLPLYIYQLHRYNLGLMSSEEYVAHRLRGKLRGEARNLARKYPAIQQGFAATSIR